MNMANVLNTAWMWKCRAEGRAFCRATSTVAQTQGAVLDKIISRNRNTRYGLQHGFSKIKTPRDFQQRVPLTNYDAYSEAIRSIAAGEANVLTRERVRLLEPTSGTTHGEKLIPYTKSLAQQFQRAVAAWIADLMQHRPAVRHGRAYWSISPAFSRSRKTAGGIPIGFDDDTAYLGRLERFAVKKLLAVPSEIAQVGDIENFRYCTLLHLLQAENLSLISVWSPTFLTALLEPLEKWSERLCFDTRNGGLSLPTPASSEFPEQLYPHISANSRRANHLASILRSTRPLPEKFWQIWPQLALISCWTDAAAAGYVAEVQSLFPLVEIQPKGLLATEGCISFPLIGRTGAALALRSHFFEFQELDDASKGTGTSDNCRLAHELDRGGQYRVILTTGGGLYRYQLYDIVEVVGYENQCPLLKFMGRSGHTSDLVGEKLTEMFVRAVLNCTFAAHGISPAFAMLVPVDTKPPHYRLYLQDIDQDMGQDMSQDMSIDMSQDMSIDMSQDMSIDKPHIFEDVLAFELQSALEANPHYRYAVQLGQLAPLEVCMLDACGERGWLIYERGCIARGKKPGDIKPTVLDAWTEWPRQFDAAVHPSRFVDSRR